MKMLIPSAMAVAAICLVTGCETTGLSPRETAGASYPHYILCLDSGGTNAPQHVSMPMRLAVVQIGEDAPPEVMLDKLAKQKRLVASVSGLPLPDSLNSSDSESDYANRIKTICGLAQATGANFVFLFGGNMDDWDENNSSTVMDATVVGAAIFPGTKIHMEGKGAGVLISTATCRPVLFVSADVRGSSFSPDFFVDGKTKGLRSKVRDELVDKLGDQFINKLTDLSAPTITTNY
jgi:hypothetical protein